MKQLTILGKITPVFKKGENLKIKLMVEVDKPLQDIVFRFVLRSDSDIAIGTSWSKSMSFSPGEQDVYITYPLSQIEKGIFYASIGFFKVNDLGGNLMLDHVDRAFRFEVQGTPIWNTHIRGYLRMEEIDVHK